MFALHALATIGEVLFFVVAGGLTVAVLTIGILEDR